MGSGKRSKIVHGGLSAEIIESPKNTPKIFSVDVNFAL
jgi:hypothetical protein